MYILRIINIRSDGIQSSFPITSHNFSRLIESYARRRSIKANPSCRLAFMLCWIIVYRINAYSIVVWCARNPACVGACRFRDWAVAVRRWLIVVINTLAKGGGMAMLR
jgi:hypothetical protein